MLGFGSGWFPKIGSTFCEFLPAPRSVTYLSCLGGFLGDIRVEASQNWSPAFSFKIPVRVQGSGYTLASACRVIGLAGPVELFVVDCWNATKLCRLL